MELRRVLGNLGLALTVIAPCAAAERFASIAVGGDSISKAFNGQGAFACPNEDQEQYNWATSDTNDSDFCSAGSEAVFSIDERLECEQGGEVGSPSPNQARSGAQMLKDYVNQANAIKSWITSQPPPRLIMVLLGHNDLCAGKVWKYQLSCEHGSDQDPNNYCRTTGEAFEREFRKGLDILITLPETKIGVASILRVSQLCNFSKTVNCQQFTSCQSLWSTFRGLEGIFGGGNGICGSLTTDCSNGRIEDAYRTALGYRNILREVTGEYAQIPEGGTSRIVTVGGEVVGGARKAPGATLVYSDAPWKYKFSSAQLSCCDCFHPSPSGQDALARIIKNGLRCEGSDECCRDTGNAFLDGRCKKAEKGKDPSFYPGLF